MKVTQITIKLQQACLNPVSFVQLVLMLDETTANLKVRQQVLLLLDNDLVENSLQDDDQAD